MIKSANPFASMDFTKMMDFTKGMDFAKGLDFTKAMGDFKFPGVNVESLVQAQRKNFEAIAAANQLALEGYQAVAKRQADIVRESIEEFTKVGQELTATGTAPDVRLAKQAELAKAGFEKGLSNARELGEILMKSNTEAFGVISKRVAEALDEVKHSVANGAVNGKVNGKHK